MESGFCTFILFSSFVVYSSHVGIADWDDVQVAREGSPTTLVCTDATVRGAVSINWMVKSLGANEWNLVLSANERNKFSGGASKASMQLADPNFQDTGVFSLFFIPRMEDGGLYSCLIKQQERRLKEKIIPLAILKVTVHPAPIIPQHSTLRMIASINPDFAITKINWVSPDGISIKSEKTPSADTEAKLPRAQTGDSGVYVCSVHPWGNNSSTLFTFNVNVTVDAEKMISFENITYVDPISTATQAQTALHLICPGVLGDYVVLYWQPPDTKRRNSRKLLYEYDRWRGSTLFTDQSKRLQLAGPPYNAEAGSFSFLLTPDVVDGGIYICEVFRNDNAVSQWTHLSVLKVNTKRSSSTLELGCQYSELSQVRGIHWKYQDTNRHLKMSSNGPGKITTTVPLPITSDTAGNYTCILKLRNGQTVWATQAVTLPHEGGRDENGSVTTPSMLPSLSALLLLVPLVAAAVGVLLWRQKHISDRGIEQSMSAHSGEVENIYENPEDIRQASIPGSVYMDLKPRGEDDVYKELERSEQCQS